MINQSIDLRERNRKITIARKSTILFLKLLTNYAFFQSFRKKKSANNIPLGPPTINGKN